MGSATKGRTTIDVGADGVAVITIINPPVNSLSFDVLNSLKDSFDQALRRDDVKAIVVTGAKGKFSGGFDITAFGAIQSGTVDQPKRGYISVEILTETVEAARKPSVAAIDGLALGGGLEVAMACHARISTSTAQLGLPELQLGIIPGFGGTQRLPRLVGITKALEMMLTSKPVKGEEGHALGLVDAIVSPNELVNTARQWALDILERRKPWVASLYRTDKLDSLGEAREIFKFARAQAWKQAPNLKHPLVCIDVVEEGVVSGPQAGLWKEADEFQVLVRSDTCKSLVHIFLPSVEPQRFYCSFTYGIVPGITDKGLMPRRVNKVAVLGGGLMGSGIATALILSNYQVILKEVNEKFLQAGIDRIRANLQSRVKKGKMSQEKFEKTFSLLKGVLDYESFKDVDMVIERTRSQDRIIGAHFFSPAHVMPLLEIVRTNQTSPQAIVDLLDVGKKIRKTPVVVGNCTGFAVNRMFFPYTQAAILLVERGTDLYQIDRAITKFGMPMGPSGETTRKGFYLYNDKRKASPDPELRKYVEKARSISGVSIDPKLAKLPEKDIVEMIFFPVVNEACRVFAEGIALKLQTLTLLLGGILFWADSLGSKYIYSRLEEWSKMHGEFFKPCDFLAEELPMVLHCGTFWRIVKHGCTEDFESIPYVCTLLSAALWTYYGIIKPGAFPVATVNGFGILVEIVYVTLFLIYAPPKMRAKTWILLGLLDVGFLAAAILVTRLALQGQVRIDATGSYVLASILLCMVRLLLPCVLSMHTPRSIYVTGYHMITFDKQFRGSSNILWFLCDYFLGVPNGAGFLLGTAQLVLYAIYRNAKPSRIVSDGLEEGWQHQTLISSSSSEQSHEVKQ
ncbi:hypothetical protein GH714_018712 [Hevea brasiliensis]|uniref:Uncharacterized protein n=1 Tax=Hevea brasiliensis TaxID=3981 RepID=A0A6A6MG36_HEVBR|nr:hypothetical protein GH714_018712 [Hevea brasiliensis]